MKKDKMIATLLSLFGGGLGLQWFYLRKPTRGVLYILFFFTFIPLILAWVDFFKFAFMTDEEFDSLYN